MTYEDVCAKLHAACTAYKSSSKDVESAATRDAVEVECRREYTITENVYMLVYSYGTRTCVGAPGRNNGRGFFVDDHPPLVLRRIAEVMELRERWVRGEVKHIPDSSDWNMIRGAYGYGGRTAATP